MRKLSIFLGLVFLVLLSCVVNAETLYNQNGVIITRVNNDISVYFDWTNSNAFNLLSTYTDGVQGSTCSYSGGISCSFDKKCANYAKYINVTNLIYQTTGIELTEFEDFGLSGNLIKTNVVSYPSFSIGMNTNHLGNWLSTNNYTRVSGGSPNGGSPQDGMGVSIAGTYTAGNVSQYVGMNSAYNFNFKTNTSEGTTDVTLVSTSATINAVDKGNPTVFSVSNTGTSYCNNAWSDYITFKVYNSNITFYNTYKPFVITIDQSVDSFSVDITNSSGTYSFYTNNGTIYYPLGQIVNLTIYNATGFARKNYENVNTSATYSSNYFNLSPNQVPNYENLTLLDSSGNSELYYSETLQDIYLDIYDPDNWGIVNATISIYDTENNTVLSPTLMTYNSGNNYSYSGNIDLTDVGYWYLSVHSFDVDGGESYYNITFAVDKINVSNSGKIYGYDFESLPSYSELNLSDYTYDYYLSEIRINKSTTWSTVSTLIENVKSNNQLVTLTLYEDLSDVSSSLTYLDNFSDLIDANHLNGIRSLKIYVPDSVSESEANSILINNISKKMFQKISNKFPIYIRNYNESHINNNYAFIDSQIYITADSNSDYLNKELGYLKNSTDTSRMYYSINSSIQNLASTYQTNIINKMRSSINTSSDYDSNIGELLNRDIVVFNNESTEQTYTINTIGITQPNAYILTKKEIAQGDATSQINVTVASNTAVMVYFSNLTKIIVSDGSKYLYGIQNKEFATSVDLSSGNADAFLFDSGPTNPDDGRIMLYDPSYNEMGFYVWYGTNGYEAIGNWSKYSIVIIGDNSNSTWVSQLANDTELFGYVSVGSYGSSNYPLGCTPSVDCTTWNRTYWIESKESEIDTWTNMQDNVNLFIDGLDIGAVNDVDGYFGDSLIILADYVKISKQRKLILNTYTSYEDYANLGDYTMRESACGRWDGSVNNPTYSYEDISLEIQRANFHKQHGLPVLAEIFGNITDYQKSYYCYMQTKVLYGDLASVSYNQPKFDYTGAQDNFQWNYYKYPNLGSELENDYTVIGTDSYSRRFENGIVIVNTTSHTTQYITDDQINSMQLCGWFYDNDDGPTDEGYMHFIINDNMSRYFNINDSDLINFAKTYKCTNISTDYYEPSGFYEIEFWYVDSDGNYLGNDGIYVYEGVIAGQDRLSFWENILNDHQSNDETDYYYYSTGRNWAFNFSINRESTESAIDEVSDSITRSTISFNKGSNVTFSSLYDWALPIYDKVEFLMKQSFSGVFVDDTKLNLSTTNCDSSSPTYSESYIGSDSWKACSYEADNGTYVKVVVPHLSEMSYTIEGNSAPSISLQTPSSSSFSITEPSDQIFLVNVTDLENSSLLSYWYVNETLMQNSTISTNDSYTFYGNYTSVGEYDISYVVSDGEFNSSFNWTMTVNNTNVPPIVEFVSQDPIDINALGFLGAYANITYNITDVIDETPLDNSSVRLFYKTYSNESPYSYFTNGTATYDYVERNYSSIFGSDFSWSVYDNQILPARYNLNETLMEITPHNSSDLNNNGEYFSIELLNISSSTYYNYFEVMANRTSGSGDLRIYYCNSSYDFNSVVSTSQYCTQFATYSLSTYNHSHSSYSKHIVLPFVISSGHVNSILVSSTSYFMLEGVSGSIWTVYNIPVTSRTNAIRSTNSNGISWSSQAYTIDSHLHQYYNDTTFIYYACANDTINETCSSTEMDLLQLGGLPPTSPNIYLPSMDKYYTENNILINYSQAMSPNHYNISYYDISLLNPDDSFNMTITANNSENLTYDWNISSVSVGNYSIEVTACDTLDQCSNGISNIFEIDINYTLTENSWTISSTETSTLITTTYTGNLNSKYDTPIALNYSIPKSRLTNYTESTSESYYLVSESNSISKSTNSTDIIFTIQPNITSGSHTFKLIYNIPIEEGVEVTTPQNTISYSTTPLPTSVLGIDVDDIPDQVYSSETLDIQASTVYDGILTDMDTITGRILDSAGNVKILIKPIEQSTGVYSFKFNLNGLSGENSFLITASKGSSTLKHTDTFYVVEPVDINSTLISKSGILLLGIFGLLIILTIGVMFLLNKK